MCIRDRGSEWKAYEAARLQLDTIPKGPLKVYRSRCEKIVRTLFLYHVANLAPDGLSAEDLMNSVCLLYTSDAADERSSVDLGGRRLIKQKTRLYALLDHPRRHREA